MKICLWFNGNAREAAEYYANNLPGGRVLDAWNTPVETPGNAAGEEVTVNFEMMGCSFVALNGGPEFEFSEAVSFEIPCKDQEEIDYYWNMFIQDGGEASVCGWLKDKFGFSWQISSPKLEKLLASSDREAAGRATNAMLQMTKIDLAEAEKAFAGA